MANWYYKKKFVPKNVFIIKMLNTITNEVANLSSYNFSDYKTAVEILKANLVFERVDLLQKEYAEGTDMTQILKGFIEVHEKLDGKINNEIIKVYNYNF